jgi:hypothetical protein
MISPLLQLLLVLFRASVSSLQMDGPVPSAEAGRSLAQPAFKTLGFCRDLSCSILPSTVAAM